MQNKDESRIRRLQKDYRKGIVSPIDMSEGDIDNLISLYEEEIDVLKKLRQSYNRETRAILEELRKLNKNNF